MKKLAKSLVGFVLYRLGGAHLLFLLHRLVKGRPVLVALTYHRIVDGKKTAHFYTDYDRGMDVNQFRVQVTCLRRYFELVDLDNFIAVLGGRQKPQGHTALLTFDDADSEFMSYAYPVLSANDVPAVVMTPTGLVESPVQFWHIRMSNLIMSVTDEQWESILQRQEEWPEPVRPLLDQGRITNEVERRKTCRAINVTLDSVAIADVEAMIAAWEQVIDPVRHLDVHCMTWQELQFLEDHGIEIESHTVSHLKLTMLDEKRRLRELVDSKLAIEKRLGKTVRAITYPQGYYDEGVGTAARKAGYEVGFTTVGGICRYPVDGIEMFRLPRMDVVGDSAQEVVVHLARMCLRSLCQDKKW